MDLYPSILLSAGQRFREFDAYLFDKLDGRQVRAEWTSKRGWQFGTKERRFDGTDVEFGPSMPIFMATLAEPLTKLAFDSRWRRLLIITEYWGPQSLGGVLVPGQAAGMRLTLIDAAPDDRGLMLPKDFIKRFKDLPTAKFLGRARWTRGFVERVWLGEIEGVTFEGVVGKTWEGDSRVMAKAKTKAWNDAIHARYPAEAEKIVNS